MAVYQFAAPPGVQFGDIAARADGSCRVGKTEAFHIRLNGQTRLTVILIQQTAAFARRAAQRFITMDQRFITMETGQVMASAEVGGLTDEHGPPAIRRVSRQPAGAESHRHSGHCVKGVYDAAR